MGRGAAPAKGCTEADPGSTPLLTPPILLLDSVIAGTFTRCTGVMKLPTHRHEAKRTENPPKITRKAL
jgi:hypothetical protein